MPTLDRTVFEMSRLLEYFSGKELAMQLGAEPSRWGLVLIRELIDNALDGCETAGIAPEVCIDVSPDGFKVADNGPGIPSDVVTRSLDYAVRVSDKSFYASPSGGAVGHALKLVYAAPFVIDPDDPGRVSVSSQGLQYTITVGVDRIAQGPRITHTVTEAPFVKTGTIAQAAQQAGVSERTLYRWLQQDEVFRAAYQAARRQAVQQAIARLQQSAGEAVDTLRAVMRNSTNPASAQVTSARTILEFSMRAVELEDLEERLAALEQHVLRPEDGDG